MIIVEHGDMFLNKSAKCFVNPVNCVGVMGKGLALVFKNMFPLMYADYEVRCKNYDVKVGEPYLYIDDSGTAIINFPTKRHWKQPSYITDIEKGLDYLVSKIDEWGVDHIAMPGLGCGLGGLEWETVFALMEEKLGPLKQTFYVYTYLSSSNKRFYAGVGSRNTPADILKLMSELATELSKDYIMRSGGADGADTAFYNGCRGTNCIIYLPWPGFNGAPRSGDYAFVDHYKEDAAEKAKEILLEIVPYYNNLKPSVQSLFKRNVYQVLGDDVKTPADFVICWTENGELKGGTRIAIMIANKFNIPVFNLAKPNALKELREFLENEKRKRN